MHPSNAPGLQATLPALGTLDKYLPTSDSSSSLDDDSTSMGVGAAKLDLRDEVSVPATLALFLWPASLETDSFLLSKASDSRLVFKLSEWSEDADNLAWLIRGFFGAVDLGVGLEERVSRRLWEEIFVSGDEISMGSSEVEDLGLGLGIPDLDPFKLDVLNVPWPALPFPLTEEGVGEGVLRSLAF